MKSREPVVGPVADEQALQDLEDMRAELLHEIQDGDELEDERVEVVSFQVARVRPGRWDEVKIGRPCRLMNYGPRMRPARISPRTAG
jgi:hypothetical protein